MKTALALLSLSLAAVSSASAAAVEPLWNAPQDASAWAEVKVGAIPYYTLWAPFAAGANNDPLTLYAFRKVTQDGTLAVFEATPSTALKASVMAMGGSRMIGVPSAPGGMATPVRMSTGRILVVPTGQGNTYAATIKPAMDLLKKQLAN